MKFTNIRTNYYGQRIRVVVTEEEWESLKRLFHKFRVKHYIKSDDTTLATFMYVPDVELIIEVM